MEDRLNDCIPWKYHIYFSLWIEWKDKNILLCSCTEIFSKSPVYHILFHTIELNSYLRCVQIYMLITLLTSVIWSRLITLLFLLSMGGTSFYFFFLWETLGFPTILSVIKYLIMLNLLTVYDNEDLLQIFISYLNFTLTTSQTSLLVS